MGLFYRNQPFLFGESIYRNGGIYGPLQGSYINLIIVLKGSATIAWDEKRIDVPAGQASLIYNRDAAVFYYSKETVVRWCETGEPAGSALMRQKLQKAPPSLELSGHLRRVMELGMELIDENRDEVRIFRDSLGETLLCAYLHQANLDLNETVVPESIIRAKKFIDDHFCEDVSAEFIAKKVGVRPQFFSRAFKARYRASPMQYVWSLRAEKGAQLLRQTTLTAKEIAGACGYKNPFHFSRQIKEMFGHAPSELRSLKTSLLPTFLRGERLAKHYEF